MVSIALQSWRGVRFDELNELAEAHVRIGGKARGRRFATQQINRSYAVMLASHWQGFMRDLHSECVVALVKAIDAAPVMRGLIRGEFSRTRELDRRNATPASIAADFKRIGLQFWDEIGRVAPRAPAWRQDIVDLNRWRNAIAHQDFSDPQLGETRILQIRLVRRWRNSCDQLAFAADRVVHRHLIDLTGAAPWVREEI